MDKEFGKKVIGAQQDTWGLNVNPNSMRAGRPIVQDLTP
jgi:hypothetical protein